MADDNVFVFPAEANPAQSALVPLVEGLLFAAGEPVTVKELCAAIGEGAEPQVIRMVLHELSRAYAGRGLQVVVVRGAWQVRTRPEHAEAILRLRQGKPSRMSKAALEVLSVVAYRQPVTRSDIENLRGVSSGGVLKLLLDKGYLRVTGRREEPGRPLEYGTTPVFLEMFSLPGLGALPTLEEREDMMESDEPSDPAI